MRLHAVEVSAVGHSTGGANILQRTAASRNVDGLTVSATSGHTIDQETGEELPDTRPSREGGDDRAPRGERGPRRDGDTGLPSFLTGNDD